MNNATNIAAQTTRVPYGKYDLLFDEMDGRLVRFSRWSGSYIVVMDRDTMVELPDERHPSQVMLADLYFRSQR